MGSKTRNIYALMTISTVFWAGAFIAGKIGVQEFPPFSLAFFRFFFATAIIFGIMLKYESNWKLKKGAWVPVIVLGIVGMFGYHVLFFTALQYTTAINSSMIGATNPLITSILATFFLKEPLGIKRLGAIGIAFLGVVLTLTGGDLSTLTNWELNTGDLIMLAAVLCWAIYGVISKRVMHRYSPILLTAYSFLVCLIVLIPFVIMENPVTYMGGTTWRGWTAVLYMSIFPSVIGYLVQQMSIKEIGPSRTAAFINLVPVFSIILSGLILGEQITAFKLLSAAIIISGVYLNTRLKALEQPKVVEN